MPVDPAHYTVWLQVARMQDFAQGQDGHPRSAMADSPIGRAVWYSTTAQAAGNRTDDLAEGYARLVALRQVTLEAGLTETDFVRKALSEQPYGAMNRWILETFLSYKLTTS